MIKFNIFLTRLAALALGVTGLSSLSFAAVLCPTSAPAALSTLGVGAAGTGISGACSYGANTFSNISLTGSTIAGAPSPTGSIDPTLVDIQVTSQNIPGGGLINLTLTNPTSWALSGSSQFTLVLSYTVTGGPWFASVGDSLIGSATSNSLGNGSVSFDKSAGGVVLPNANLINTSNAQTAFPGAPLSTFNVTDNIQVHASNASATLNQTVNSFVVPEPMTSMLLGTGLLGFGLMLRRKRR